MTGLGMISGMNHDVTKLCPVVPTTDGELAWIVSRIDQSIAALPKGTGVHEAWIEVSPAIAAILSAQLPTVERYAGQVLNAELEIAVGPLSVVICILEELDDFTFTLSLELDSPHQSIHTTGILGFCYPHPVSLEEIETRWVLQYVDGVDGGIAAPLAKSL
jgi:hypothetical protein